MHAGSYLLKLKIDYVSFSDYGQTCPDMPKDAFKTLISLISQKLMEIKLDFLHATSFPLTH